MSNEFAWLSAVNFNFSTGKFRLPVACLLAAATLRLFIPDVWGTIWVTSPSRFSSCIQGVLAPRLPCLHGPEAKLTTAHGSGCAWRGEPQRQSFANRAFF